MKKAVKLRIILFTVIVSAALFSGVCVTGYASPLFVDGDISITKTGSPTTYSQVGDMIKYTYVVTTAPNLSGDGSSVYALSIYDDRVGDVDCPKTSLLENSSMTCTGSYTITKEDIEAGEVTNNATLEGRYQEQSSCCGCGEEIITLSASDDFTVTYIPPELSLEKTGSPTTFTGEGEEIAYTYTISNIGQVNVTGPVTVDDDKVDVTCPSGGIPVGESIECSATYSITKADVTNGSIINTATASASGMVSNEASFEATFDGTPDLSLSKESDSNIYQYANDILRYSFTLTNTGNVPLSAPFVINDPLLDEFRCTFPDTIAVGSSFGTECYGYYRIRAGDVGGNILNCATATGTYEGETITSAEACAESQYAAPPEAPPEPQGVCDTNPGSEDCCTENPEHESCADW